MSTNDAIFCMIQYENEVRLDWSHYLVLAKFWFKVV